MNFPGTLLFISSAGILYQNRMGIIHKLSKSEMNRVQALAGVKRESFQIELEVFRSDIPGKSFGFEGSILHRILELGIIVSRTYTLSNYFILFAAHPWRFARFSGSEKSLKLATLCSPSSSTRVKMESESYSIWLGSASVVWHIAAICARRYTL